MAQGDMYYPSKLNSLHSAITNNYLLKHGNIFNKPELLTGNGYPFPFFAPNMGGYSSGDTIRELVQDCAVPLNFAIKHEKPPTPPASTSPVTNKSPPLQTLEDNSKNLGLQFPIDDSKNSTWISGKQKLSWDNSIVASYNPETKMFRCVVCNAVGFLSRIAEHYLGTHTSAKVFQCLHCPYSSTWSRCVRMHMAKHHSVPNAPPSLWKGQPLLEEIFQLLTNLKTTVDSQGRDKADPELSDKKFVCPKCPYTTDRRDLYQRHENIHKEDKPYHCYICFKLFNRADHVKKHFLRIHRGHPYDISLVRRRPPRSTSSYPANTKNASNDIKLSPVMDKKPNSIAVNGTTDTNAKHDNNSLPSNLSAIPNGVPLKGCECPYCPWEGADAWCLRRHMNVHVKTFECPICDYKSAKAERLFTHVYKAHMMLVCTKCKFVSDQAYAFENHIKNCCVEIVTGTPYPLNTENQWQETRSPDSVLMARDVNLLPMKSTDFSSYADLTSKFPLNLKDQKGSLSVIPLHNSISYCFPTNPVNETCGLSISDASNRNSMDSRRLQNGSPVIKSKIEIKSEFGTPIQNFADSKQDGTNNGLSELDLTCWECGCEFADGSSLEIHTELHHRSTQDNRSSENSKNAVRKRFSCALCNFSSNEQRTILDHMRYHTGESLVCKAGDSCIFTTIFDSTLREHVQDKHSDGRTRCPHCGILAEARIQFIRHYRQCHHSTSCYRCRDLKRSLARKDGESGISSSSSSSSCTDIRPYLHHNPYSKTNIAIAPYTSRNSAMAKIAVSIPPPLELMDEMSPFKSEASLSAEKRSRKQTSPRKLVQNSLKSSNSKVLEIPHCDIKRSEIKSSLLMRYREKFINQGKETLWCCRLCYRKPVCYRNRANHVRHHVWYHFSKKRKCKKCKSTFNHTYQLVIHKRKNDCTLS